jgi:hypothetical protein
VFERIRDNTDGSESKKSTVASQRIPPDMTAILNHKPPKSMPRTEIPLDGAIIIVTIVNVMETAEIYEKSQC